MAVLDSNQTVSNNTSGFDKGIHASARTMMLDNLQALMYQKPIQSAVRECVSNAVDAVKEKITAKKIKSGEAKVSDFYLTREDVKDKISKDEDDIYQDSEFNPDYYDLQWLSDTDTVKLEYYTSEQTKRDIFKIIDPGVGLGGKRLEGFFSLGYSSKRLNTNELGGFGLGAKSPLATGVESYRILTRYNGKEFCFDIYSHKVDCVYGKWGDDGKANKWVEFSSVLVSEKFTEMQTQVQPDGETIEVQVSGTRMVPYKAYYKDTTEKNGTELTMEVKKHNRHQYFEAVRSQLMYLKSDITFTDIDVNGRKQDVPFKAAPIYEDNDLVLSDYGYYSRPHFVIKNVSYGLIDFNEADLQVKHGNIGIKFNMEDLDVVPSRESVRYTPKTTQAIIAKYASVARTVEAKIQKELKQTVLVDWVRACNKILYTTNSNSNDVVARMSQLTDSTSLQPNFKDTEIKYTSDVKGFLTPVLAMQHVQIERGNSWSRKQSKKINRTDNTNVLGFDKPLYFQFGAGNNRVTHYLAGQHEREGGFCVFRTSSSLSYLEPIFHEFVQKKLSLEEFKTKLNAEVDSVETDEKKIENIKKQLEKATELVNYLMQGVGSAQVGLYTEAIVPDSFKISDTDEEDEDTEVQDTSEEDYEEQRKREYKALLKRRREEKAFIASKLKNKYASSYQNTIAWDRCEVKGGELDFDNCKIVLASDDDLAAVNCLYNLTQYGDRTATKGEYYYWNDSVKILKVAKTNLRYVKEATPLADYLLGVENGILKGNDAIRKVFTSRIITKLIARKCNFMRNFNQLNPSIGESFEKLTKFVTQHGNGRAFTKETVPGGNKYVDFLNKHYEIQLIILENPSLDPEAIQDLIDEAFDKTIDKDITGIELIDIEMFEEAKKLAAFADVYGCIFNHIGPLQDPYSRVLDSDLSSEIKVILESKKDQLEYEYEGLNKK